MSARPCDPSLVVTVNGAGLNLAMGSPIARVAHPPLFIPWDDVTVILDGAETAGQLPLWVGGPASTLTLSGPMAGEVGRLLARPRSRPARRPGH